MCKKRKRIGFLLLVEIVFFCFGISGCSIVEPITNQTLMEQAKSKDRNHVIDIERDDQGSQSGETEERQGEAEEKSVETRVVPEYQGIPYITINDNMPNFTEAEYKTGTFETYGELD